MNKITSVAAIIAAVALVAGTLAVIATPAAYAGGGGNGNTIVKQHNKGVAIASGFGTTAANIQSNCISFLSGPCP
jgi:hypothetical protein